MNLIGKEIKGANLPLFTNKADGIRKLNRILLTKAMVRLSAGRNEMNYEQQALCFLAGANSIFSGEKLLTTPNPDFDTDKEMFELLGLKARESFKAEKQKEAELN